MNEYLDHVDTQDLVDELRRRSRVFFLAMRPLGHDPEYTAVYAVGVDGQKGTENGDERDRCFGLAFSAAWELMMAVHK